MDNEVKFREGHHHCHFHRYARPVSAADSHRNDELLVVSISLRKEAPATVYMEDGHKEVTGFNARYKSVPGLILVSRHTQGFPPLFLQSPHESHLPRRHGAFQVHREG